MPLNYSECACFEQGHIKGVTAVSFSPTGSLLASAGLDGRVCIWDTTSLEMRYVYTAACAVLCCAWRPSEADDVLFCGLRNGSIATLRILKVYTGLPECLPNSDPIV